MYVWAASNENLFILTRWKCKFQATQFIFELVYVYAHVRKYVPVRSYLIVQCRHGMVITLYLYSKIEKYTYSYSRYSRAYFFLFLTFSVFFNRSATMQPYTCVSLFLKLLRPSLFHFFTFFSTLISPCLPSFPFCSFLSLLLLPFFSLYWKENSWKCKRI